MEFPGQGYARIGFHFSQGIFLTRDQNLCPLVSLLALSGFFTVVTPGRLWAMSTDKSILIKVNRHGTMEFPTIFSATGGPSSGCPILPDLPDTEVKVTGLSWPVGRKDSTQL